jgi:hypothetical protein
MALSLETVGADKHAQYIEGGSMSSRRKRKRERRQADDAGLRGDREKSLPSPPPAPPYSERVRETLCADWTTASRSDLLLFRKAIKEDWPIPFERRRPLMATALSPLSRKDTPFRRVLAIARLALAADLHDLEMEEQAQRKA